MYNVVTFRMTYKPALLFLKLTERLFRETEEILTFYSTLNNLNVAFDMRLETLVYTTK